MSLSPARTAANLQPGGVRSRSADRVHVMHVITGLGVGGAETMLCKLIDATRAEGVRHSVVSLTDGGAYGETLEGWGVTVHWLRMRPGVPDPLALSRLARLLRRERPDVVQSWMYHADLLAGVAALAAGRIPVVWGIRHANVAWRSSKPLTNATRRLCGLLSGVLPARIVSCAESARAAHVSVGYRAERMTVIPNGFALDRLVSDPAAWASVRDELSIPDGALVVGSLARFHPDKDHRTLVSAARVVASVERRAVFLLAGDGVEWANGELSSWIDGAGLRPRFRLLGRRADVPRLLSAFDVLALSSRAEAFPNVLGEAMACGVPCVATDCGDSREIVGSTGRIVPPRDPDALARATLELLALTPQERAALGRAAAERVRSRYDLRVVARRYLDLYAEILEAG